MPKLFLVILLVIMQGTVLASQWKPIDVGHPPLMSPHTSPIVFTGGRVFVVNTPSDTVDVIDSSTLEIIARIDVGIDPVTLAVRPDGREVWVSNHVSDSVSVIDVVPVSPTYLQVVATIQEFDPRTKATRFDEPCGIAFASNSKAYVALSSENEIAVIDVASRKVQKRLKVTAQDPRAIVVRGDRLFVVPFESNNKTQLSGGSKIDGKLVTFDAHEHSVANNNVLSLGHVTDIVKHPRVPDRDLFVFDTKTDRLLHSVETLGTLLYGLAVDSEGTVFIAQTDARNDANGRAGTQKHGLKELENRAFLNQITQLRFKKGKPEEPKFFELEPLPPQHPSRGQALATPFAIQISDDDSLLVATAAGSDKLFTLEAQTGKVLGRVSVGAVPRGIALQSKKTGQAIWAWVLNAVANSVSLVDVSNPARLELKTTISLKDPTPTRFKQGRIAFNTASASTTGTFSCASCHPDGHTDQLLWVLKTPIVEGGNQIMPRSTMPVRGLRDTAPFHWDGIPGDPYGGINSASLRSHVEPNSSIEDPASQTRHLVDGGLAATMAMPGDKTVNDEGKPGLLSKAQRDDLSSFLLGVPYPPAQRRAYTNKLSERAKKGFDLFHIRGDNDPKQPQPNVCGDCHRMPFWVSTNTPGSGMDAPTWRGAYDRFLILPQGRLNIIDFPFYRRVADTGNSERQIWQFSWAGRQRFDPVWEMVLEGSTGYSGAFGRQVTLDSNTAERPLTRDLLDALEIAHSDGGVVLTVEGVFLDDHKTPIPVRLQFDGKAYQTIKFPDTRFNRQQLVDLAKQLKFVGTFTGRHGGNVGNPHPQPALWTLGPIEKQRGRQVFPRLSEGKRTMILSGRHIQDRATLIVDGRKIAGDLRLENGERVVVTLKELPPIGMHFLQVQNPGGLISNEFIFHVGGADFRQLQNDLELAIRDNNLASVRKLLSQGAKTNALPDEGSSPLSSAAFHGRTDVARLLLEMGARPNFPNRDGNTPLHVAAFLGRKEIVDLLLEKDAPLDHRNNRGETPLDTVSGAWSEGLEGFYRGLNNLTSNKVDLSLIPQSRTGLARLLRNHADKTP